MDSAVDAQLRDPTGIVTEKLRVHILERRVQRDQKIAPMKATRVGRGVGPAEDSRVGKPPLGFKGQRKEPVTLCAISTEPAK